MTAEDFASSPTTTTSTTRSSLLRVLALCTHCSRRTMSVLSDGLSLSLLFEGTRVVASLAPPPSESREEKRKGEERCGGKNLLKYSLKATLSLLVRGTRPGCT